MKVVISIRMHDLTISKECAEYMASLGDIGAIDILEKEADEWYGFYDSFDEELDGPAYKDWNRTNPNLVKAIEVLGKAACRYPESEFKVVEVPDDAEWYIRGDGEAGGYESIYECARIWH